MKSIFSIIWLFPILFMLHDFEEILMINAWQQKYHQYIKNRKGKYIPYNFKSSTASIALGVAIEFAIISLLTIISYLFTNYIVWYGFFAAYVLHLLFHLYITIDFKKYVPGVTTAIIFLPISLLILYETKIKFLPHYNIFILLLSTLISTLIMVLIVASLHKAVEKFSSWIQKYSSI